MVRLRNQFHQGLQPGDQIPDMGYETYKVRLPNPSAKRGKSGGFRVIYYLRRADFILLLTIYSKTEQADVASDLLRQLIEEYEDEQNAQHDSDTQTEAPIKPDDE